jgi:glucose-fructose oxidoreductase
MEKPFAASLSEADQIIAACHRTGRRLAINWPMAWYPTHLTAYRLINEGRIGEVREVHYYDGNRGPLWHTAGKEAISAADVAASKPTSWFYQKSAGGGSLLDYLGYGTTLGTWFNGGQIPLEVTAVVDQPAGLEVDEHAIVVARYESGLSKFETRWGTFTDPWTAQPQPKCGFVIVGSEGTLSCFDYESTVRLQSRECLQGTSIPVDNYSPLDLNPVYQFLRHLETKTEFSGTMSLATCRIGQRIVDTAVASAAQRRSLALL